jgi:hypothetical protein
MDYCIALIYRNLTLIVPFSDIVKFYTIIPKSLAIAITSTKNNA